MFNPLNLLSKIIKSGNQKELDRIGKIVNQINGLEKKFENIDNSDFPKCSDSYPLTILRKVLYGSCILEKF